MVDNKYRPEEYLKLLVMSKHRHLLVEGNQDKMLFKILFDHIYGRNWMVDNQIDIDTAEELIHFEESNNIGNRDKVENICKRIEGTESEVKLVGFVDREYRDFEHDDKLLDNINGHKVIGRLVWSRGHSIENYYFDYLTLRNPLRGLSYTDHFDNALYIFEDNFNTILRLACAVSLTGLEILGFTRIKSSLSWKELKLNSTGIALNVEAWNKKLVNDQHLSVDEAERILNIYYKYFDIVQSADAHVLRWMCHGHIALSLIWEAYARCVYEVNNNLEESERQWEVHQTLKARENTRFSDCCVAWAQRVSIGECEYPSYVFDLLRLADRPVHEHQ